MGAMTVQVVGRHIALPRGLGRFSIVQPQLGVSAGGSVTLASLRIKMRLGRGNRCHDHGMVGIRSASGKPPPSTGVVSLLIARRRDPSCGHHDGYMSTVAGPRCRPACARPLAGARLSMTPSDLVPRIRASR
jgi:hypothetical protein